MRTTVVIATLRRAEVLASTLAAVAACTPPPAEVLVVDGDERRSAEPTAGAAGVRYLWSPPGLTRQRNLGLASASGDVVVFLDDDARPRPDALARLTAAYTDPGVVGATGRVVEPASNRVVGKESKLRRALHLGAEGTFTAYGYPRRITRTDAPRDVECMSGCFMSARVPVAAALRFDERLSGYGLAEDEDFSYRLSRRGRIRYVPDAVVDHDNAGFGGRDRVAFNRAVVVHRAYLFAKNFPQTPRARAGFTLLVPALVAHRLLNGDLAGVRGLLRGAHEAREARRTGEWAL